MTALVLALVLALGLSNTPGPCAEAEEGTDLYYSCLTGEADIDIGVQDEADEPISQGRN